MNRKRQDKTFAYRTSFREFMQQSIKYNCKLNPPSDIPEIYMSQKQYVDRSGAQLILHLEPLDEEVLQLSFVTNPIPPIPRANQSAGKPSLSFQEYFTKADEQLVWEYCCEDFEAFEYERLRM